MEISPSLSSARIDHPASENKDIQHSNGQQIQNDELLTRFSEQEGHNNAKRRNYKNYRLHDS
jgi:hypothetical protein